jgi:peptide/nickel transport system substrate-binding protein
MSRTRSKFFARFISMAAVLIFMAGMVIPAAAETVLRIRLFGDLKNLDPIVTTEYIARNHGYMVYDTLFAMDEKLEIKPQMVKTYQTSSDGLTWTFTLRDGLRFHDGQPVTSQDVIASLNRWGQRDGLGSQLMSHTEKIEKVDDMSFRIVLKDAWGLVLDALGKPSSNVPFIMPARLAKTPANKAITDPTGSGPFKMLKEKWMPGAKVVYVRNADYVPRKEPASGLAGGKVAKVDRVEWLYMPDPQTAANALRAGELDIFEEVTSDLISMLKSAPGIKIAPQDLLQVQMVFRMNLLQPPFNNPKIRQAIRYMVDQEIFLKAYVDDPSLYTNCPSYYMCKSPYFTDEGWFKQDLDKARQLIKESGYKGTPVVVLHATDSTATSTFSSVAEQLMREIGLKVDPQAMDWGTLTARRVSKKPVSEGGWSLFISGPSGADMMEPVGHLALRSSCEKAWIGWPCDDKIEQLRAEFSMTTDMAKRKEIAREIQIQANEYVPYVPLGQFSLVRGYSAKLSGILKAAIPVYWNIQKNQ